MFNEYYKKLVLRYFDSKKIFLFFCLAFSENCLRTSELFGLFLAFWFLVFWYFLEKAAKSTGPGPRTKLLKRLMSLKILYSRDKSFRFDWCKKNFFLLVFFSWKKIVVVINSKNGTVDFSVLVCMTIDT